MTIRDNYCEYADFQYVFKEKDVNDYKYSLSYCKRVGARGLVEPDCEVITSSRLCSERVVSQNQISF